MALVNGTALDSVLGRLIGPRVRQLNDDDLIEAIRLCVTGSSTNR